MNIERISRRDLLRTGVVAATGLALGGCGYRFTNEPQVNPTATPTTGKQIDRPVSTAVARVLDTQVPVNTPTGSERLKVVTATPEIKSTATISASKECLVADSAPLGEAELKKIVASVPAEVAGEPLSFADGKYQTFPRQVDRDGCLTRQLIDLGTLGPDVDTIFGIDFAGDIKTGAFVIYQPDGKVSETRVVGIKRADLETIQLQPALGGDRFDVYRLSEHGGDPALNRMAILHAINTARTHQKVIYVGDIGLFENEYGKNEREFLNSIIRAQRPERLDIIAPNFVSPRTNK